MEIQPENRHHPPVHSFLARIEPGEGGNGASTEAAGYGWSLSAINRLDPGVFDPTADRLVIADRHIIEGEKIVAAQRILIEKMRQKGADTSTAESTLKTFQRSLESFYSYRDEILRAIAKGRE